MDDPRGLLHRLGNGDPRVSAMWRMGTVILGGAGTLFVGFLSWTMMDALTELRIVSKAVPAIIERGKSQDDAMKDIRDTFRDFWGSLGDVQKRLARIEGASNARDYRDHANPGGP